MRQAQGQWFFRWPYPPPIVIYHIYRPPPPPPSAPMNVVDVRIGDNYFSPIALRVPRGSIVRWTNYGWHRHTVTSTSGLWDSGEFGPGGVFAVTFVEAGTYDYYCRLHPQQMRATVVVY